MAQILPGPNVVNLLIMLGDRYFGIRGSLVAIAGIVTVPLCIVLVLVVIYGNLADNPYMQSGLRGMSAAAAGLIGAAGIKMLKGFKGNVLGIIAIDCLIAIIFIAFAFFRVPLIWAVLGFGTPACLLAWTRLRKGAGAGGAP